MKTNKTPTAKRFAASVAALAVCFSMFIGSTFAWFTDTASSGVNTITAGNLDIKVSYKNANDTAYAEIKADSTDLFVKKLAEGETDEKMLWEPGAVSVCYLEIENAGSLALQYKLAINAKDTVTYTKDGTEVKLSDALKFAYIPQTVTAPATEPEVYADRAAALAAAGAGKKIGYKDVTGVKLEAGEKKFFAVAIWMPENTDNTYNLPTTQADGTKIDPLEVQLGVSVAADQVPHEKDSFDENYDLNAVNPSYAVDNAEKLNEAMADPEKKVISVEGGSYSNKIEVAEGKTMIVEDATVDTSANYGVGVSVGANAEAVFNGGSITAFEYAQVLDAQAENSKITVNDGTYEGNYLVCVDKNAQVTVNGGTFCTASYPGTVIAMTTSDNISATVTITGGTFYSEAITDNFIDVVITGGTFYLDGISNYPNMITKDDITIKGGTFNVDPTAYLAEGYTAAQNGGMWVVSAN